MSPKNNKMNNELDEQDKLAEEWAKALEDQEDLSVTDEGGTGEDDDSTEGSQDNLAEEWAKALASDEEENFKDEQQQRTLSAKSKNARFKDLTQEAKKKTEGTKRDLDFILDIPLTVTAQLGGTQLLINELLQLGQGSVIELNKLAGEPMEVLVNGKLVARGEAVVINEKFGIRLTDIISPVERIKQLG